MFIMYDAKTQTFSRCDKTQEIKYEHGEERDMDLELAFAVTEEKGAYGIEMPKQTHEPMKHKIH